MFDIWGPLYHILKLALQNIVSGNVVLFHGGSMLWPVIGVIWCAPFLGVCNLEIWARFWFQIMSEMNALDRAGLQTKKIEQNMGMGISIFVERNVVFKFNN